MGSSPTKFSVTISNSHDEAVYVFQTLEAVPFNYFLLTHKESPLWFSKIRGCQRISTGDSVTLQVEVPRNTSKAYFSIGTESGTQISDSLPREADSGNLIITRGGSTVNAKRRSIWTDVTNKYHNPDMNGNRHPNYLSMSENKPLAEFASSNRYARTHIISPTSTVVSEGMDSDSFARIHSSTSQLLLSVDE